MDDVSVAGDVYEEAIALPFLDGEYGGCQQVCLHEEWSPMEFYSWTTNITAILCSFIEPNPYSFPLLGVEAQNQSPTIMTLRVP